MNTDLFPIYNDQALLKQRRLWYLLALILLLLSVLAQQPLVLVAALFTLLIGVVPELWYRYALRRLVIRQKVDQQHLFFGEEVTLSISIENRKLLPLSWLDVEDKITPPLSNIKKQDFRLQKIPQDILLTTWLLGPLQRVTRRYRMRGLSRGLHTFGPVRLRSSDPFGWLECEVTVPATERLLIYPLIAPLETLGLSSIHPFGDYASRHRLLEDPLQITGVRDYRQGDDLRRIHWKATAHTGTLQSKVYEPSSQRRLLVLLDAWNYSDIWKGPDLDIQELSITVAASITLWSLDEGYIVGLLTNSAVTTPPEESIKVVSLPGAAKDNPDILLNLTPPDISIPGVRVPFSRDHSQYERLLSTLARLAPRYNTPIERLIDTEEMIFPAGTTIVLVSATTSLSQGTIERLQDLHLSGAVVYLTLLGHVDEKTTLETYDLPVHYPGGSEKWYELIGTLSDEENGTLGTSSTPLQLD